MMNRVSIALVVLAGCRGGDRAPSAAPPVAAHEVIDAGAGAIAEVPPAIDAGADAIASPRAYKAALHRGRALARQHDWRGAVASFDAAVAAAPPGGDARALTELG